MTANAADPGTDREQGDQLTHYDIKSGKDQDWQLIHDNHASEPVFVPRGPDAAEGDGWVLSVVYRAAEDKGDLAVFEATDIAKARWRSRI